MTAPEPSDLGPVADALTAEAVAAFAAVEQQLIADTAAAARAGLASASGRQSLRARMRDIAYRAAQIIAERAPGLARDIAARAAEHGTARADHELAKIPAEALRSISTLMQSGDSGRHARPAGGLGPANHATSSAQAIADDLARKLADTAFPVLRYADDAYRAVIAEAATREVAHDFTPAQAQSHAWRELTRRGVSGYTDKAGRQWDLATYVEMATRTAVQRAYNASHLERMLSHGIELFTVPDDGHPCKLCQPWQGTVLSLTDSPTIAEAQEAGLWHPNCRHVLVAYLPGRTALAPAREWTAEDQVRYAATQHQRALERQVRAAKREAAAALTELDRRRANRDVREAQARIRVHVEQHGLVRRPRREQLHLGNA